MRTQTRIKIKSAMPRPVWNMISSAYRRNLYSRYKKDMTRHPDSMTVFCPCCGLKFREFVKGDYEEYNGYYDLTLFEGVRQDVCCPVCESLPRHRIEILWCEEHMDLLQGKEILYFAVERSEKLWMKRKGVKCTTADLFAEADLKLDIQDTGLFMEDAGFEVSVIDGKDCPEEVLPVTVPCKYDINRLFLCRKV